MVLAKSFPAPSVPVVKSTTAVLNTDHISQEAYVTETSRQSPHAAQASAAEHVASGATAAAVTPTKSGPITSIRNFFKNLFSPSTPRQSSKSNTTVTTSTSPAATESTTTITTTTVATSHPPAPTS